MAKFVEARLTGDLTAALTKFEQKVQSEVILSGAAGMAKVLYEAAQSLCPVSDQAHIFYGSQSKKTGVRYYFEPGNLKAAIYRVYSPERSTATRQTYRVTWNQKKAPYGFMVEFGTSRAPAQSFMRPALQRMDEAINAGNARMQQRLKTAL